MKAIFNWLLEHIYPERAYRRGYREGCFAKQDELLTMEFPALMMKRATYLMKRECDKALFGNICNNNHIAGLKELVDDCKK